MVVQVESKWLNLINPDVIKLHPLQFANCKRLNKHNVVYLFDEVGSGKTISSGIMALEYLENKPNENVLVITTNALAQKTSNQINGQFKGDWLDKLPFEELGYESKISVVNNHHSKFKNPQKYGLVIIDEAHLFLNEETERYHNLCENIQAEKLVFLTATPIKENAEDLKKYVRLAEQLLKEGVDDSWIDGLDTYGKIPDELICSKFSLEVPVTRYFKDTIKSLGHEGFNKIKAKRYETLTWEYSSSQDKDLILANQLKQLYEQSSKNKFVVFTRYVEKEAYVIGTILEEFGFSKFEKNIQDGPTYTIVTGENRQQLSSFSKDKENELPTVLILTYQIAEQGINLPGFNYIVNYHISSFPSALEQRYGRIDRLNSNHEKIYNCFLIKSGYMDTNTFNFYSAINTSVYSLLTAIPSRNTLLSKKILQYYINKTDLVEKYIEGIKKLMTDTNISDLYFYLKSKEQQVEVVISAENYISTTTELTINEDLEELISLVNESQIDVDSTLDESEAIQQLTKELKTAITEIKRHFNETKADKDVINKLLEKDDSIWDQIFYSKDRSIDDRNFLKMDLNTADAIDDCAKTIENNQEYKDYLANFNISIRLPLEFKACRATLNSIFEEAFIANNFEKLFPHILNKKYVEVIPEIKDLSSLIKENLDYLIPSIPLFKMISQFKNELICSNVIESGSKYKDNFGESEHPFASAMGRLTRLNLTISDNFYNLYFSHIVNKRFYSYKEEFSQFFKSEETIVLDELKQEQKAVVASAWLKLAFHLTRGQSLKCLLEEYYTLDDKRRFSLQTIYETKEYPHYKGEKEKGLSTKSLFSYMVFRNSGDFRPWFTNSLAPNLINRSWTRTNDYWTQAIMNSIYGHNYSMGCTGCTHN